MADATLKWILQQKGITTVIPGFKSIAQVESNVRASEAKAFTDEELKKYQNFTGTMFTTLSVETTKKYQPIKGWYFLFSLVSFGIINKSKTL